MRRDAAAEQIQGIPRGGPGKIITVANREPRGVIDSSSGQVGRKPARRPRKDYAVESS
jgi:hypothetical protein